MARMQKLNNESWAGRLAFLGRTLRFENLQQNKKQGEQFECACKRNAKRQEVNYEYCNCLWLCIAHNVQNQKKTRWGTGLLSFVNTHIDGLSSTRHWLTWKLFINLCIPFECISKIGSSILSKIWLHIYKILRILQSYKYSSFFVW